MAKKLALILLFSLIASASFSQVTEAKLKANVLFYIADYIIWPYENSNFTIGFYGDNDELKNEILQVAKAKKIKGTAVNIKTINGTYDLADVDILFVCNNLSSEIPDIFQIATDRNILLVTEYQANNLYTMVNFVLNESSKKKIAFEVNKQNITSAKLDFKQELLLYGGTEVDIKKLYKDIQKLLETERQNVKALQDLNNKKQIEIAERNDQIFILEKKTNTANQLFLSLNDTIKYQRENIGARNIQIQKQIDEYNIIKTQFDTIFASSNNLNEQINYQTQQVKELDKTIHEKESTIKVQSETISQKETRIQEGQKIVYLVSVISMAFLIIGIMLLRAYQLKRKNNTILEMKVEERTQELKATNDHLINEIIERQKFEQELILSVRNYREIFNATTEAIFIHDATNGAITDVNDPMLHLYGYTRKELASIEPESLNAEIDSYNVTNAKKHFKRAVEKGFTTYEWYARKKNGTLFWVEIALKSTEISGKNIVLAVVRDVDEKKKTAIELDNYRKNLETIVQERTEEVQATNEELEDTIEELSTVNDNLEAQKQELEIIINKLTEAQQQLLQSEKLASLGIFTAGIAHEINNPVNFISSGSSILFQIVSDLETEMGNKSPKVQTMFEEIAITRNAIETGIERTTAIISSLRNYARTDDKHFVTYNVINCINDTLLLLHNTYKYHVEIVKTMPETLEIECIPGRINQLFVNIINNATQAIEKDGLITIKAEIIDNKKAIFEITDNGCGMEQLLADKIFDPFFTTKAVGKGTGLGLYIVHGIIEEHNAIIEVITAPGKGTCFKITFPLRHAYS